MSDINGISVRRRSAFPCYVSYESYAIIRHMLSGLRPGHFVRGSHLPPARAISTSFHLMMAAHILLCTCRRQHWRPSSGGGTAAAGRLCILASGPRLGGAVLRCCCSSDVWYGMITGSVTCPGTFGNDAACLRLKHLEGTEVCDQVFVSVGTL